MWCPRLDHFVRFNPRGTVSRCGHMIAPPEFSSLEELDSSEWLQDIKSQFDRDTWPAECRRCEKTEHENNTSIRLNAIDLDRQQTQIDYLQVGGILDNLCNAGCLTCDENYSSKIGSLKSRIFPIVDNSNKFWNLPQQRIIHLDINGGEPSYSKNYKRLLQNLPPNLKTLRLNTNGSTVLKELGDIAARGIEVTVTVSFDGIGAVHELVRWPLQWDQFYNNVMAYKNMPVKLNLWTTVSALNVDDLPNIIEFAKTHNIDHSYAYLARPDELAVENKNTDQCQQYIKRQQQLRNII